MQNIVYPEQDILYDQPMIAPMQTPRLSEAEKREIEHDLLRAEAKYNVAKNYQLNQMNKYKNPFMAMRETCNRATFSNPVFFFVVIAVIICMIPILMGLFSDPSSVPKMIITYLIWIILWASLIWLICRSLGPIIAWSSVSSCICLMLCGGLLLVLLVPALYSLVPKGILDTSGNINYTNPLTFD